MGFCWIGTNIGVFKYDEGEIKKNNIMGQSKILFICRNGQSHVCSIQNMEFLKFHNQQNTSKNTNF